MVYNTIISRRRFLGLLAASAGAMAFPHPLIAFAAPDNFCITGVGRRLIVGGGESVYLFDADTLAPHMQVNVGFLAHTFLLHPGRQDRLWAIQRYSARGPTGQMLRYGMNGYDAVRFKIVEIDLNRGQVISTIVAPENHEFRGHGFFLPGTDILFTTLHDAKAKKSHLVAYDTKTGEVVRDFHIAEGGIHETRLLPDGTALVAASGFVMTGFTTEQNGYVHPIYKSAAQGAIYRIDITSGKQLSRSYIEDKGQTLSHFAVLSDGRIVATSKSLTAEEQRVNGPTGKVFMGKEGGELKPLAFEEYTRGAPSASELFSIVPDEANNILSVTDYYNNVILRFDARTGAYRDQKAMQVSSMIYDRKADAYIVCGASVSRYDDSLTRLITRYDPGAGFKGASHSIIL